MVAGLRSRSTGTRVLTLALLVLCMVTNQAPAQTVGPPWEKLGDTPALTLYIDRTTLQRDGSIRRVLEMQDLKVPDPDGVMSRRFSPSIAESSR